MSVRSTITGSTVNVLIRCDQLHRAKSQFKRLPRRRSLFTQHAYAQLSAQPQQEDADTYLLKPMDKTFSDPSTMPTKTGSIVEELRPDEAPLPKRVPLGYAPTDIAHVTSLAASSMASLQCRDRFDSTYPEQNLLNHAHRNWGNILWAHLRVGWNVNLPNMNDIRRGVKSVHEKLWDDGDQLEPFSDELRMIWKQTKAEKEGFYDVMGHRLGWLDLGPIC
ncbi:uncharacterized protein RSE6_09498 [Rhynchosporium secalis]|uniref:Uncharacterized protein n=1 Tax=Rhynchosporium secalis TaxID=38038 RepID=A0A1E1MI09_RHYSE|nr:uncharacterized protein RSE6_09498 [Rhynchosporium secalis]